MNKREEEIKGHKRKEYEHRIDLAGEHKLSDIGQLILLFSFLVLWILDSFVFKFSTFLIQYVPNYVRGILSSFTLIFAGFLAFKAHGMVFGEERDEHGVIKKGVFAVVRHPMYLGFILLFLGLFLATFSLASLGFWIIIIIFYDFISSYEERLLLAQFGEDYENYRKSVAKWIPGLKFKKNK
ncbi:MAG: isoprenylcysteine carboxylmethyltransferase family protein [Asgard group archaeon]|nr:isoprenylcysteine carboxylmethyltransferase family protein [Asgard group archaeon]